MSTSVHQGRSATVGAARPRTPAPEGTRLAGTSPWYTQWFCPEQPGPETLASHVLAGGGRGGWWTDRPDSPRALLLHAGPLRVLRGDPQHLDPVVLRGLERGQFTVPDRFLPVLGRTFETVVPWRRMVYVQFRAPRPVPVPDGFRVRPVGSSDAGRIELLDPELRWLHETWGAGDGLAAGARAWGAFAGGRLVALACTYLRGWAHEDVAVATLPDCRRLGLALACVTGVTAGIRARGRTATWTVPRSNEPSRALALAAGFRPVREDVAYWAGRSRLTWRQDPTR